MYLLDTNVVSELRKARQGRADPQVLAWSTSVALDALYLSVVTLQELETGIGLLARKDAAQAQVLRGWLVQQVLPAFDGRILPITPAIALRCGSLHVPDPRPYRDSLIAATALVHGFTVVTRNTPDFALSGLRVLNPWLPLAALNREPAAPARPRSAPPATSPNPPSPGKHR